MILSGGNSGMWEWEKSLYGILSRNARPGQGLLQDPALADHRDRSAAAALVRLRADAENRAVRCPG